MNCNMKLEITNDDQIRLKSGVSVLSIMDISGVIPHKLYILHTTYSRLRTYEK